MTTCTPESGTCDRCKGACTVKPGWFKPGEAEKAAEFLGLSLEKFFRRYLAVDWWEADEEFTEDTFVLSPAVVGEETGTEFPSEPEGTCVFFKEGRCQIHPVKPFECRAYYCGHKGGATYHKEVAFSWVAYQQQIHDLLGREPEAAPYEGGLLGGLFGGW